jgi:flavin-dependent dehydrogenase
VSGPAGRTLDVAIIGAGLAGSLLARQLRRRLPELRVGLFEKSPTTSFKVGESVVDLASNYMVRRLGLSNYLYSNQLPKNGLRFFFDTPDRSAELSDMSEIGTTCFPFHQSFQIDRARLEADLRELAREDGVELHLGARVQALGLSESGDGRATHRFAARTDDSLDEYRCRWLVDASGRTSLLARQQSLRLPEANHALAAGWARFRRVADLDTVGPDAFRQRIRHSSRMLSTVHFCYPGYWIWFIPLGRGVTSVGVVSESAGRAGDPFRTQDGLMEFLGRHRAVGDLLRGAELLDFWSYRQLAYGTRRYFSGDRWALTGEAAAFTDPFYSPGSDFIALENDLLTDLIARDHRGEPGEALRTLADLYSRYMAFRHEASMRVYRGLYPILGSYELFRVKWQLDIALYYHMWVAQYLRDRHLDPDFVREEVERADLVLNTLANFAELFQTMVDRFQASGRYHRLNLGQFADPLEGVDFVRDIADPTPRRLELKRQGEIFNRARRRALELLGDAAAGVSRDPVPLSRFGQRRSLLADVGAPVGPRVESPVAVEEAT